MQHIVHLVVRRPFSIIIVFVLLGVAAQWIQSTRSHYDFSYRTMVPKNTPEFALYEEFLEVFSDAEDVFVVAFRDDPLITNDNLVLIDRITGRVEALEATERVNSLTNALDIRASEDGLEVSEFVDVIPQSPDGLGRLLDRLTNDPLVAGNLISHDGLTAAIVIRLFPWANDADTRAAYFDTLERILDEEGGGRVEFHLTGHPYLNRVLLRHVSEDTAVFMPLVLIAFAALLWLTFGQMRAIWMPLLPIWIASTVSVGMLSACGLSMSVLTGEGVLSMLIMVIALSDTVHLMSRYEEDIADDPVSDRQVPLGKTIEHIGAACLLTSMTTAIGFGSLAVADIPTIRDFGIFGALGIAVAYLGAILLLPAAILLCERWRRSKPPPRGVTAWLEHTLGAIAGFVARYPRSTVAAGVVTLLVSATGFLAIGIDNRVTRELKPDDPAVRSIEFFESALGGVFPLQVVINGARPDAIKEPRVLEGMEVVRAGLESLPDVSKVISPSQYIKKMNRAMHDESRDAYRIPETREAVAQYLLLYEMAGSDAEFERLISYDYSVARMTALTKDVTPHEYDAIVGHLRELIDEHLDADVLAYEAGEATLFHTAAEQLITTLLRSLYLAMPLVLLMTALAFRSASLGVLSILPNALPLTIGMAFAGVAGIDLRYSTIIAFPVAFGLAVDDTIHLLARYRTELAAGRNPVDAVRVSLMTTGRAMLLTTVFLMAGFATLLFSNFLAVIHIAVLIMVILVAALFGDLFVLPALLIVFQPRLGSHSPEAGSVGAPSKGATQGHCDP